MCYIICKHIQSKKVLVKRVSTMLVEELEHDFTKEKNYTPSHVNELLDFLQKRYIYGEISIIDYKKTFFELDKLKAEKPNDFIINSKQFNLEFDRPS